MTDRSIRIGRVRLKGRANVVCAGIVTRLDLDPAQVLAGAAEQGLDTVIVIGIRGGDVLWLLERMKKALLSTAD